MIAEVNLVAFIVAAMIIIPIPGPSVLFVVGRSVAFGRRTGLISVVGNALGNIPLIAAVAVGLGALVTASAVAMTVVKIVGAGYLVFLGVHAIRNRGLLPVAEGGVRRHPAVLLWEGFVVGATNPKTLAFLVAVLPQFVDPAGGAVSAQLLALGAVFVLLAWMCDSLWALAAGSARDWFARSPRRRSALAASGGAAMIGLGGVLLVSDSHI